MITALISQRGLVGRYGTEAVMLPFRAIVDASAIGTGSRYFVRWGRYTANVSSADIEPVSHWKAQLVGIPAKGH